MLILLFLCLSALAGGFGQPTPSVTYRTDWSVDSIVYDWSHWDEGVESYCSGIDSYEDAAVWASTQGRLVDREVNAIRTVRAWYGGIAYVMENPWSPVPQPESLERMTMRRNDPLSSRESWIVREHNKYEGLEVRLRDQSRKTPTVAEVEVLRTECRERMDDLKTSWIATQEEIVNAWSVYAPKIEQWAQYNSSPIAIHSR